MSIDVFDSAREMAESVRQRRISSRELLELHLERIAEVNPDVNALVSLDIERARTAAAAADERLVAGEPVGALHGLPFAFKDTHAVAGWRTTYGSPLMHDYVPDHDVLVVERIRAAGAVPIAKTNTPEWAAGSHTFNPLFGTTRNPYDLTRSAGGSSGGAAAALASGMVPLAEGSDMGGSLRNPASFCNVVGLRPSFGRVPDWPTSNAWTSCSVPGPMARNVDDLALLLSVIAGPTPHLPQSSETPGSTFAALPDIELRDLRVALSVDLDGAIEVATDVVAILAEQREVLAGAGAVVVDESPDLAGADQVFRTLRAWHFHYTYAGLLEEHPSGFKSSLADNIRAGAELSGTDVATALEGRTRLTERMREFFESVDVLALPVSPVPPFSAAEEYPTVINATPQHSYLDWMRSAYFITVTGCPAISVPAGFTEQGWPVGLQLVAAPNQERRLLAIARAYERLTRTGERRPAL